MNLFDCLLLSSLVVASGGVTIDVNVNNLDQSPPEEVLVTEWVYLDIKIDDYYEDKTPYEGRLIIGVFGEIAPMTVLNFITLAKGYKKGRKTLKYEGTPVHRVIPDFIIQMGDVTNKDGSGGTSIFGPKFIDEDFIMSHGAPGIVAMANYGPDTNGSQFYITLAKARWLDGNHVVFGKVIKGMDTLRDIGELKTKFGKPLKKVKIVGSGTLDLSRKYTLTKKDLESEKDTLERDDILKKLGRLNYDHDGRLAKMATIVDSGIMGITSPYKMMSKHLTSQTDTAWMMAREVLGDIDLEP